VNVQPHRIPAVGATDRHPLIDPADAHFIQQLDTNGRYNLARVGDDGGRVGTTGGCGKEAK
jgi:hypothetical protein